MPLQFGEPPRSGSFGHNTWRPESDELRARPGEWALLATKEHPAQASNFAARIRDGLIKAFAPAGSFEAMARGKDVWARYVGEDQS